MRDVNPDSIRTYQIEARGMTISGNAVLDPRIEGDNMVAILSIFRGEAPLAGAPEQAFETTTTVAATTTTRVPSSTAAGGTKVTTTVSPTTVPAATTTTVAEPTQNTIGNILPDPTLVCN